MECTSAKMSSSIDTELASLYARIAQLEEAKKAPPPVKSLEAIRDETEMNLKRNSYSKSIPLAAFYDRKRLETVNAVLDSLNRIHARLDALEKH
jgi:hypothetical protein